MASCAFNNLNLACIELESPLEFKVLGIDKSADDGAIKKARFVQSLHVMMLIFFGRAKQEPPLRIDTLSSSFSRLLAVGLSHRRANGSWMCEGRYVGFVYCAYPGPCEKAPAKNEQLQELPHQNLEDMISDRFYQLGRGKSEKPRIRLGCTVGSSSRSGLSLDLR